MQIVVVRGADLEVSTVDRWRAIQAGNADLASACFSPEFTQVAAAVRKDARVAILEDAGRTVGYFPHHRLPMGICKPIGAGLSDFNGLIVESGVQCETSMLMKACGCRRYEFQHQLAGQEAFVECATFRGEASYMDLSKGFNAYAEDRRAHGTMQLKKVEGLARKLAREVGSLRFVADVRDEVVMNRLYELKSRQYRETGLTDIFAIPWMREFVARMFASRTGGCMGMLSALWADDELLAMHFGIRSETVLTYWFPVYDPRFARYSPGLILLLRLAEWCATQGITRIDLGKGDAFYKKRLASGGIALIEGVYDRTLLVGGLLALRRRFYGLRHGSGMLARIAGAIRGLETTLRR